MKPINEGPMNSHDAPARISGILSEAERLIGFARCGYLDRATYDKLLGVLVREMTRAEKLVAEVQRLQGEQEQLVKAAERALNCDCLICTGCTEELEAASGKTATDEYDWRPMPRTPIEITYSREMVERAELAESRLAAVEQEKAQLQADAEWRQRWHERLGRGTLTEGKFYERIAAVEQAIQQIEQEMRAEVARVRGYRVGPVSVKLIERLADQLKALRSASPQEGEK